MKMKNYIYSIWMLLTMLWSVGCTDTDLQPSQTTDNEGEKVYLKIGLTLPEAQKADTRAFNNTDFEFEDLHVAVFVQQGNMYILQEFVRAEKPTPTGHEQPTEDCTGSNHWDFGVELTKAEGQYRLHFIANYTGLTMGLGEESNLIGRLLTDEEIAEHDVYWNYVDVTNIDDNTGQSLQNIPLVRNFTQVRLQLQPKENVNLDAKFQLLSYALHNVPKRGTVAPYNSTDGSFANYVKKDGAGNISCQTYENLEKEQRYIGNEPYGNELIPLTEFKDVSQPFYSYERTHVNVNDPTCIIIKGKYAADGNFNAAEETYYKLDFIHRDEETNTNVYYNLLRNFIYTMNIIDVTGEGYATAQEAINNPASNNISGNANIDDFTNISDGTGRLFVSTTYLVFTDEKPIDIYYQYIPDIATPNVKNNKLRGDGNGEIVVTAKQGNVLAQNGVVASADETSGQVGWRKITLTPKAPPANEDYYIYTQDITVASNHLQRKVTLVMRNPYEMSVHAYDPTDNDKLVNQAMKQTVDVKVTIPGGMPQALFPLKFYVTSAMNSIYAKPGSDMYSETYNGTYGFVKEISWEFYNKANEDGLDGSEPVGKKENDGRISFVCNFLTNCAENATDVYVDNEYFNRGSDRFTNPWKNSVTLGTAIRVDIQKIYGRYPYSIYNGGNNNGSKKVSVALNGEDVGSTITIDRDNVTSGITFTNAEGISKNDVVEFTFTDKYWYGQWSDTPITYKATSTLGEIDAGTTLVFTAQGEINKLTRLEITTSQKVSVPKDNNRYPQKIYNKGTEEVSVTLNGENVGRIFIDSDNVTSDAELVNNNGFNSDDLLTFTFSDRYYSWFNWQGPATYTATCTVEELLNGVTLDFRR